MTSTESATSATSTERMTGKVKWFNNTAGFGFITACDGLYSGKDIFVHYSAILVENTQYKYLIQGEYVDFDLVCVESDKYEFQAVKVSGVKGGLIMCETRRQNMESNDRTQESRYEQPRKSRQRPQESERSYADRTSNSDKITRPYKSSNETSTKHTSQDNFERVVKKRERKATSTSASATSGL
jgi:CspA family cold shock protein